MVSVRSGFQGPHFSQELAPPPVMSLPGEDAQQWSASVGPQRPPCLDLNGSEGHSQPQSTLWDQLRSNLGGLVAALPLLTPALLTCTRGGSPPGNLLPATLRMSLSQGTQPETQDQRRTPSSPHCFLEHQLEDQGTRRGKPEPRTWSRGALEEAELYPACCGETSIPQGLCRPRTRNIKTFPPPPPAFGWGACPPPESPVHLTLPRMPFLCPVYD